MTDDKKGSMAENTTIVQEIRCAINRLSMERESNTPDYVLAEFLSSSFAAFNAAVNKRETHYGRNERPGNCKIDDKGAGEEPYKLRDGFNYGVVGPGIPSKEEEYDLSPRVANMIFNEGRKAERERCADIAEGYFNARGRVVAKAIRGGQDAK